MADRLKQYEVLYRTAPAWRIGAGLHYPGDYAGIVIAVRPIGHAWGPGDLSAPARRIVEMWLTDADAAGLRSHRLKIVGGEPVSVTFDDRHGHATAELRERFANPEAAEAAAALNVEREPDEINEVGIEFSEAVKTITRRPVASSRTTVKE